MNQYTPVRNLEYDELNSKVKDSDYDTLINYAYDLGLAEGLKEVEDYYIWGYRDCFLGEEPMIFDEELRELIEQEQSFEDCEKEEKLPFLIDTEIIDDLENMKKDIIEILRSKNNYTSTNSKKGLFSLLHDITVIQEKVTTSELHHYLGYK